MKLLSKDEKVPEKNLISVRFFCFFIGVPQNLENREEKNKKRI
jgi:hypothetical protein